MSCDPDNKYENKILILRAINSFIRPIKVDEINGIVL